MSSKKIFLLMLTVVLCWPVTHVGHAKDDNNLVYVIQFASVLQLGVAAGSITIPFDANFAGIPRPSLSRRDNWVLEVAGAVVPNEPARVRVEAIPNPRFIRLDVSDPAVLAGGNIRLVFRGANPAIVIDNVQTFSLIEVLFANDVPPQDALVNTNNWLIRLTDLQTGVDQQFSPDAVTVAFPPNSRPLPTLRLNRAIDPGTHRVVIRLQLPNFSEFTIGTPKRMGAAKAFTAAKGKPDSDIYFSGNAAGARGSKPLYFFESKLGYLFSLKRKGALGPRAEVNAASESNIDPDTIKAALNYEKVFVFGPAKGLILRSDTIGLEFDKKNRNRNLMTELNATLVLPSLRFNESTFATMDFMAGFEGGHNYRHELNENEGLGNLWRWKFGANAYLLALDPPLFKRIDFSTEYKIRLLRSAEPFTQTIDGDPVTTLRKNPRHYVGSDLDLMVSDALGISLKYRYGSQPPAFKFVDHSASVGLTFKLKQANK